jgi:hypothetical protein
VRRTETQALQQRSLVIAYCLFTPRKDYNANKPGVCFYAVLRPHCLAKRLHSGTASNSRVRAFGGSESVSAHRICELPPSCDRVERPCNPHNESFPCYLTARLCMTLCMSPLHSAGQKMARAACITTRAEAGTRNVQEASTLAIQHTALRGASHCDHANPDAELPAVLRDALRHVSLSTPGVRHLGACTVYAALRSVSTERAESWCHVSPRHAATAQSPWTRGLGRRGPRPRAGRAGPRAVRRPSGTRCRQARQCRRRARRSARGCATARMP